jgi:biopolymer transport protein ExbD
MWLRAKKARGSSLDITPLVDLVFLLIIFFLLSTTFVVSPGIKIDLPQAISQEIRKENREITLSVDQSGAVYLNKDLVDRDSLVSRLAGLAQEDLDMTVLMRGDRSTGFGQVVDVLGIVKLSGLHRIAIMTQPQKGPSEGQDQARTR